MHVYASKLVQSKKVQPISQTELSITTFGFMGYALIRPHYFGIEHNCVEDREAFIHFWSVIGHMLGIEERFNMCLHSLPVVEHICLIVMQYFFTPFLHFETPQFRQMVYAILDGMTDILPNMTYDYQMFRVRRIAGVTGYQYKVDSKKDKLCRQIFDKNELEILSKFMINRFGYDYIPLVITADKTTLTNEAIILISNCDAGKVIGSDNNNYVNKIQRYQNDSKFKELSIYDKVRLETVCLLCKFYQSFIGWHIMEMGLTLKLYMMKRFYEKNREAIT